jgi:putative ABC transport system permease protein
MFTDLFHRLRAVFRRSAVEHDLDEELRFHVEQQATAYERAGLDRAEALRRARLEFGGLDQIKEEYRDTLGVRLFDTVLRDLRLAVRALRAAPIVSIVAVLSLTLGIGANTAIFSVLNGLVLRTLPVKDPNRLVLVSDTIDHARAWSYPIWLQIQQRRDLFEDAAAWSATRFNLTSGGGETQFVDGLWVSGSFFRTLGVTPHAGRILTEADDRRDARDANTVAVISHGFWQRRFGAAADIVGRRLTLDGASFTIVGVMPPEFFGAEVGRAFDVAVPLAAEPLSRGRDTYLDAVSTSFLTMVGRLQPNQTAEAATAALRLAQPAIRDATNGELSAFGGAALERYLKAPFVLLPGAAGFEGAGDFRGRYQRPLWTLLAVVALVLVIACVNVANLLLARANARKHELSLRLALGASRLGLARQLLTESLLLSAAGAAGGLWLATWSADVLVGQLSTSVNTVVLNVSIDRRIVAFTIALAALTTLVFGTAPALSASSAAPIDALKDHSRGATPARSRLTGGFVVAQVALSVVLLVTAGLFIRTFTQLAARPLGFEAGAVTIVTIDARRHTSVPAARMAEFVRARDAVRALPEVEGAALSFITPFTGGFTPPVKLSGTSIAIQGRLFGNLISPGWFRTLGTPLLAGRDLTDRDVPGAPRVVVVNDALARTFFPGRSPIGETLSLYPDSLRTMSLEIVGVAGDAVYSSLRSAVPPTWYAPLAQFDLPEFTIPSIRLSVRSRTQAPPSTRAIAAAVGTVNPDLPVTFRPLADHVHAALTQERLTARLAAFFGALALLLAALGLYGVTSYAVSGRRTEIGIRLALGAGPATIIGWVLGRVSRQVGAGIALGAALSLWASTFVAGLIYGVPPRDPATLAAAAILLSAIAAFAAWLPARRAARIDPIAVLRES